MINQLVMIGKIKELPNDAHDELILEVRRNYKNSDGVFEKDHFKCYLWMAISKKIMLTCKEGDLIAVKGRVVEDNGVCKIFAEQVVLLNKMVSIENEVQKI